MSLNGWFYLRLDHYLSFIMLSSRVLCIPEEIKDFTNSFVRMKWKIALISERPWQVAITWGRIFCQLKDVEKYRMLFHCVRRARKCMVVNGELPKWKCVLSVVSALLYVTISVVNIVRDSLCLKASTCVTQHRQRIYFESSLFSIIELQRTLASYSYLFKCKWFSFETLSNRCFVVT